MVIQMNTGKVLKLVISLVIIISLCSQPLFLQVLDTSTAKSGKVDEKNGEYPETSNGAKRDSPFVDITDSNVEYAIIAPHDFVNGLGGLALWHSEMGIRTKVYSMSIVQGSTGSDLQEKIHNFLVNLNSTSSSLRYVLLVGDHELIPARYLYAGADPWGLDYSYISDFYYAGLGSSWDTNHNGTYGEFGEEDWSADVLVGRIPIDTAGEVGGMVDKIINYRTNPPSGDWIEKMIVWTSVMKPPNGDPYKSHKDNAFKIHQSLDHRLPSHMDKVYLADYSELEGGNYTLVDDNFTRFNAEQQLDGGAALLTFAGQAFYDESAPPMDNALANYQGEGTTDSWAIAYNYDDCDEASNGGKLPFAFVASCDTLNFSESDDTNLERWNTKSNGGLIGQIGSSGRSWRGEDPGASRGNWWMIDKFWELFFRYNGQPAEAFYDMKEIYATTLLPPFLNPSPSQFAYGMKSNLVGYNFLGDPALDIWTSQPKDFGNVHIALWEGSHWLNMTVEDTDSRPVAGARVTMELDGRYSSAMSDETGGVSVPYQLSMGDSPKVTFYANGLIPRTVTPSVGEDPADLALSGALVVSEPNPGIGADVTLTAYIRNIGAKDAVGVKVGFYTNEFGSENLMGNLVDLGTITPGNVKDAATTWVAREGVEMLVVVVDPENDVPESDEGNNRCERAVSVRAADIILDAATLSSSNGYNVSTVALTTISIFSENVGKLTAENIRYSVFCEAVLPENNVGEDYIVAYMEPEDQTNVHVAITPVAGYKQYLIVANPENEIPETNYTNNQVTFFLFGNVPPVLDTGEIDNIELDESTFVYSKDLAELISDVDTKMDDLRISETHEPEEGVEVFIIPPYTLEVHLLDGFKDNLTIYITLTDGYTDVIETINISRAVIHPPPEVEPVGDMSVVVGEPLRIVVEVKDSDDLSGITFSDDTDLLEIDLYTGVIEYIAKESHIGKHFITITVEDSRGQNGYVSFNLTVKKAYRPPVLSGETEFTVTLGKPLVFNVTYVVNEEWKDDLEFSVSPSSRYVEINETGWVIFKVDKNMNMMGGKGRKDFAFTVTLSDGKKEGSLTYTVTVIDTEDPTEKDEERGPGSYLYYGLVGLGVIVLVVVIVVIIIMMARKKRMERALALAWESKRFSMGRDRERKVGDILGYQRSEKSKGRLSEPHREGEGTDLYAHTGENQYEENVSFMIEKGDGEFSDTYMEGSGEYHEDYESSKVNEEYYDKENSDNGWME